MRSGGGFLLPCLQNPTTHYCANNVPTGDYGIISGNPVTWIDKGSIKSIYDPCPYGYRVPINGTWAGFSKQSWNNGDIKGGSVWRSTWWPAAGYRINSSATLAYVAYRADYWSSSFYSSPTDYRSYTLLFDYAGGVAPSYNDYRSNGIPLRCVQE